MRQTAYLRKDVYKSMPEGECWKMHAGTLRERDPLYLKGELLIEAWIVSLDGSPDAQTTTVLPS